jgi:hypothetical protein
MANWKPIFTTFLAPVACCAMLVGASWFQRDLRPPADFEPFHARARQAIESIPRQIDGWRATDIEPNQSAITILKPNIIRSMRLEDLRADRPARTSSAIFMTIVQCRRVADMVGHYPPRCYPAIGDTELIQRRRPRTWQVGNLDITGTEYHFERSVEGKIRKRIVYFFIVVPEKGLFNDMDSLEKAADDYQQRYYGAAQFQVVFDSLSSQESADQGEAERDEIFETLMRSCATAIEVLKAGS